MIAILPISRCLVEEAVEICNTLTIFPPGEWEGLHLLNEPVSISGLAAFSSSVSGFSIEVIEQNALVVYRNDLKPSRKMGLSHPDDLFVLRQVVAECELLLDVARFDMCQLDLPETLFGRVGTWPGSDGTSGCVFFDEETTGSQFVGGRYLVSTFTAGIGLDFFGYRPSYQHRFDEIGSVIKQSLVILRHALEASDITSKYLHCVRLFEVLADPFQLEKSNKWEHVRTKLCSHLATDKVGYLQISERFKYFGNVGFGGERGLRERVIHHGELLENILLSEMDIKLLFREIQKYIHKVLSDVMKFDGTSWQQVCEWREQQITYLK